MIRLITFRGGNETAKVKIKDNTLFLSSSITNNLFIPLTATMIMNLTHSRERAAKMQFVINMMPRLTGEQQVAYVGIEFSKMGYYPIKSEVI